MTLTFQLIQNIIADNYTVLILTILFRFSMSVWSMYWQECNHKCFSQPTGLGGQGSSYYRPLLTTLHTMCLCTRYVYVLSVLWLHWSFIAIFGYLVTFYFLKILLKLENHESIEYNSFEARYFENSQSGFTSFVIILFCLDDVWVKH